MRMDYKDMAIALKAKLGSQTAAAKAVGVSQPTFRAWMKGGAITGENMMALAAACEAEGVIARQEVRFAPGRGKSHVLRELDSLFGAGGGGVPMLAESRNGTQFDEDAFRDEEWAMPASFLDTELRVKPKRAIVAEVVGDSGYNPTVPYAPGSLFPGDRVIIDTFDKRPSPPGPFAVFDGTGLVIKLVEPVPGTEPARFRLSSRNPVYPAYEVLEEETVVIGRVKGRISRM